MRNWLYEYYQKINDGSIIAGRWARDLYARLIAGIEAKEYALDLGKANRAITFIERFCHHHEGVLAPGRIVLELWQKALITAIFGIVDEDGARHFREVFIVIGRKNGKTLLASAIANYCAFADGEYGGRVYFSAPKLEQASICFDATYQTIITEPTLSERAKKRRSDIYIESSNTTLKPIAFNAKKSDGLNISLGVCDEIASWQGETGLRFYDVLKSSQGSRRQPLLLSISTAGFINDGVYDELMKRATRWLQGESKESRFLPVLYMIDDPGRWDDISELTKANPNIGVSVKVDYFLEEIEVARGSFSRMSEFLAKYCNIKQNASSAWLRAEDVRQCCGDPLTLSALSNNYAVAGVDLSQTTDLTAASVIVEKDGVLNVVTQFFMPSERIEELSAIDGIPYTKYVRAGILTPSGDHFVDYHDVYRWFTELIDVYKIYVLMVGYDKWSSQYLIKDLQAFGFRVDDVRQGYNLTPVIREADGLIKEHRLNIGDNDLLKIHLLNMALKLETDTGRVKPVKISPTEHIDGAMSVIDALTVRQKYYEEYGAQLRNE